MRMVSLGAVRIPRDLKDRLDAYSEARGLPMAQIVRDALNAHLETQLAIGPVLKGEQVVQILTDPETPDRIRRAADTVSALMSILKK
jgi:hypothetical protein